MYERGYERVIKGESIRSAAASCNVHYMSLHRYIKKKKAYQANLTKVPPSVGYVNSTVFTKDQEKVLCDSLMTCAALNGGLTRKEIRNLAYMLAKKQIKKIPASWEENEMAGEEWLKRFLKRHPDLLLRLLKTSTKPSIMDFNKTNVATFFKKYTEAVEKYALEAKDIWNFIELGVITLPKSDRVIVRRGENPVNMTTEDGTLVTLALAGNAIGNYIPPLFIFPTEKYEEHFTRDGPIGAVGIANESGWMQEDEFYFYLQHFKKHVRSSKEQRSMLLVDDHSTRFTIRSIDYCKENGIVLLTVPPQCTHKLQPMDRFIFGYLKKAINTACNNWMLSNARKVMSIYDIPSITKTAFDVSITAKNISAGFAASGIWPINTEIFGEVDFLSSEITDRIFTSPVQDETVNIEAKMNEKPANSCVFVDIAKIEVVKIEENIASPTRIPSITDNEDNDY